MAEPFIKFEEIIKRFGSHVVLRGITLDIPKGERFGVIGVSGGGKTTLLNILIGFYKANGGRIIYKERNILKGRHEIKRTFGFATQDGSFYRNLTVWENLLYFGRQHSMPKDIIRKRADSLLHLVGLTDAIQTEGKNLSKGMQRRLDIACALIHDPKILILDEPTEDLDAMLRKDILLLIRKINDAGTTIIITSHILAEIESICTKIAILHDGKIIETGTPDQLKGRYYKNDEIHLEASPGNYEMIAKKLRKRFIDEIEVSEHKMVVYTPRPEKVLRNMLDVMTSLKEKMVDVDVNKPTLEEVFTKLTKKNKEKNG